MPETIVALTTESFSALHAGDEKAFEALYRDRFANALGIARKSVKDAAHAARAVEHAFVAAWLKHAAVDTPAEFDRLLDQSLEHAIAHERTRGAPVRMSVGRNGGATSPSSTAPSVDVSWEHVKAQLHPAAVDPSELRVMRNQARHHAAEHLANVGKKKKPYLAIGLGAFAVIAILALLFVVPSLGRDAIGEALASPDTRSIFSKQGQRGDVKLSDETAVKLGAASRIVIPPHFTTRLRAVQLDGSASFTVASNPLPFIVRAGRATITATGTVFDVAAYTGDPTVVVRVREGSVKLKSGKVERTLTAPDVYAVNSSGMGLAATTEVNEQLGWLDGRLVLTDKPVRDVLPIFRRWYDMDLGVTDQALMDRRVSLNVGLDSVKVAVNELLKNAQLALTYQGKKVVLKDAASK